MFKKTKSKRKQKLRYETSIFAKQAELVTDNHKVPLSVLCKRLDTNLQEGLTHADAKLRLVHDGPNTVKSPVKERNQCLVTICDFFGGFAIFHWVGATVCFIVYGYEKQNEFYSNKDYLYIGIAFLAIMVPIRILSYVQESKTKRIVEIFKDLLPLYATCVRNGELTTVLAEEIVVGDIVEIKAGDSVPADLRMFQTDHLKLDNSSLTGELELQPRTPYCTHTNPLESQNMAFNGTSVMDGIGHGIAIACGDNTVIGHLTKMGMRHVEKERKPISKEIENFIKFCFFTAVVLGFALFFSAIFMGVDLVGASMILIGVFIAAVPESLLPTVAVCLSLTAKNLALRNCLIKHLEAVETLGATSTICTGKTGTLTQNDAIVSNIWINKQMYPADTSGQLSDIAFNINNPNVHALLLCAALCNNAKFKIDQEDVPLLYKETIGTSKEVALLKFTEIIFEDVSQIRHRFPKVVEIPFNPINKYQLSIHELESNDEDYFILLMKGAPEKILEFCTTIFYKKRNVLLSDDFKDAILEAIEQVGAEGEHVMGFCDCVLPKALYHQNYNFRTEPKPNFHENGYRFLGLISLFDPIRASVPDAVSKCRSAGIKVIMVTGDHPTTAKAVAQTIGILTAPTVEDIAEERGVPVDEIDPREANACVIHSIDLKELTNQELDEIIYYYSEIVFARTSPKQKFLIVESCQRRGEIVAVTGNGVNDSPALKKADIGVALGITGSDISKNDSDIILLDDNFATIVSGIEEGRLIYDNIKKSIAYALTSVPAEILPFFGYLFFKIPLPLGIIATVCINLGTNLFPAISLAYEKPERDMMRRLPRDPGQDHLVNQKLLFLTYFQIGPIEAAAGFYSYFFIMAEHGFRFNRLVGLRIIWDDNNIDDLTDSYGQEWTYQERKQLEFICQTGFFIAIVVMQWVGVVICKTRRNSIFHHGMGNHLLNFAILFETALAALLCYFPGTNQQLHMMDVRYYYWFLCAPFAVILFIYDEIRRYFIRRNLSGFFSVETYY